MFRIHYKEYLVGLVNRHGIDPAEAMTDEELGTLLERAEKKTHRRKRDESVSQHTRRLLDVCLTRIVVNTHADCIAAGVGRAFIRVCLFVCLSVCSCSKRKTASAINTKLGTHILYSSRSACIGQEVKRS